MQFGTVKLTTENVRTNIVYILCGRGSNPSTAEWLTDNTKVILATPDNGIGSNQSCAGARLNVREHARKNGWKQYYMMDDDIIGWRGPYEKVRKLDPTEIDWADLAYGGFAMNGFVNFAKKIAGDWAYLATPYTAYYYNFDLIPDSITWFNKVGREDIDFYLQCRMADLKCACFRKLAPKTPGDAFKGKSIAVPLDKFNEIHYDIYKKWGDNLILKRVNKQHPEYIAASSSSCKQVKWPPSHKYDISSLENWQKSIPYK